MHHHLFKNAGTSLDFALNRFFEDRFATLHDDGRQIVSPSLLEAFLRDRPDVVAVSSHHFQMQDFADAFDRWNVRLIDLGLIRNPLARLVSAYCFHRRGSAGDPVATLARQLGIAAFIERLLAEAPHLTENAQTTLCANHGFYGRAVSARDLQRAIERYERFSLCAPVERFDEALVVLEHTLRPLFHDIDLSYVLSNPSRSDDIERLYRAIGPCLRDRFMANNRYDLALWRFANGELNRRIERVPGFEARLDDFRARCRRLSGPEP